MRSILVICAMIGALLFQGAVFAAKAPALQRALDAAHAAVHSHHAHHHADDGSTTFDTSDESLRHMDVEHCSAIAAVPSAAPSVTTAELVFAVPPRHATSPRPDPFLEGLRRPPRALA